MDPQSVMDIARQTVHVTMMLCAPMLLAALGIGLLIGVFQAATQIQEMTLSFIPKLIAMALAAVAAGPWMLEVLIDFSKTLYTDIPILVGG